VAAPVVAGRSPATSSAGARSPAVERALCAAVERAGVYVLELGGEDDDFAAAEVATAASDVSLLAPGLATARGVTDRIARLAYTHRASELVARADPDVEAAVAALEAASLDREGSVAVRAVDVRGATGVDTQTAERDLGQVLVDRGFAVDLESPDHELRALFAEGTAALGWLAAESVRDFGDRRPGERPFFQPGSMSPLLARALANLAGARPGATVLDPMCGTGGILVEAGLVGSRVLGFDAQAEMVRGTRENLAHFLDGDRAVGRADARHLPLCTDVDGVVFDAPYGRQSKIAGDLDRVVEGALREAARVTDRAVVVGDRPWARTAHDAGWTTHAAFHRRVHRSLTRHVVVLER
jgi:tRNA (guanine10-N2)-dimethyltransferase